MATASKLMKATRSLTASLDQAASDERIVELKVADVEPDPEQPRRDIDKDGIKQLAESIRVQGLIQPIIVVKNATGEGATYRIRCGERRWKASKLIEAKTIRAIVVSDDKTMAEVLAAQLTENLHRDDMSVPDTVAGLVRLVAEVGRKGAAEQLAKPLSWVSKMMQIGEAGGAVARAIESTGVKDIEALYNLARIQKQDETVASRLVTKWASGDADHARADTQKLLDKLSGKDDDESKKPQPTIDDKPSTPKKVSGGAGVVTGEDEGGADGEAEDEAEVVETVNTPKTRKVAATDDGVNVASESVTTIREQGGDGGEYKPTRALGDVYRVLQLNLSSDIITLVTDRGDLVFAADSFKDVVLDQ